MSLTFSASYVGQLLVFDDRAGGRTPATTREREMWNEILRLRAALAAKQEQCARVADEFAQSAQDGIAMLKQMKCADITGQHEAFGIASKNIAIAIRALPVEGEA